MFFFFHKLIPCIIDESLFYQYIYKNTEKDLLNFQFYAFYLYVFNVINFPWRYYIISLAKKSQLDSRVVSFYLKPSKYE